MSARDLSTLLLFDVDGTVTESRQVISDEMKGFMTRLRKRYVVGLVGGSDFAKVQEQMGGDEG
jgi:phosphomannomutase